MLHVQIILLIGITYLFIKLLESIFYSFFPIKLREVLLGLRSFEAFLFISLTCGLIITVFDFAQPNLGIKMSKELVLFSVFIVSSYLLMNYGQTKNYPIGIMDKSIELENKLMVLYVLKIILFSLLAYAEFFSTQASDASVYLNSIIYTLSILVFIGISIKLHKEKHPKFIWVNRAIFCVNFFILILLINQSSFNYIRTKPIFTTFLIFNTLYLVTTTLFILYKSKIYMNFFAQKVNVFSNKFIRLFKTN